MKHLRRGALVLLALAGAWHLCLIAYAIAHRIAYPFDLEWMEGGVLHAAHRFAHGAPMYPPPSFDYIPFLYTPLYPALLGGLSRLAPLGYVLGRAVSVVSLLGLLVCIWCATTGAERRLRIAATLAGAGTFAAAYPYLDGWYDLVRADTLFLLLATLGLFAVFAKHFVMAACLLAAAFFCKQTGSLYLLWAGVIVVLMQVPHLAQQRWRMAVGGAVRYGVPGLAIVLGGVAWLTHTSGGWFWTYTFSVHQDHDFNMDRFWKSFANILGYLPAVSVVLSVGLLAVSVALLRGRRDGRTWQALFWLLTFFVSLIVGAIGWGTQFAHFNAYMPAFFHAGLALAMLVIWAVPRYARAATFGCFAVACNLAWLRWQPSRWIPTAADTRSAHTLVAQVAALPGDVWIPSHPWLAHLAGKSMRVHRMGLIDLSTGRNDSVAGLAPLANDLTVVLDARDVHSDRASLFSRFRPTARVASPRTLTGARVRPEALWQVARPAPLPPGAIWLADFEERDWRDWQAEGSAFGPRPVDRAVAGQGLVVGQSGSAFATSMHGGDTATGRLLSPPFVLGSRLGMKLSGGTSERLRVELQVNSIPVAVARPNTANEVFADLVIDTRAWLQQPARLMLVDEERGSWGHLNIDAIWTQP